MASTTTSAPIPIPNTHPTELQKLINERNWPAVVQRCQTDPHEVGSSSHLRNDRGYTALHTLMAYNQCVPGEELVPVVEAILRAADEIEYGAAFRLGGKDDGGEVEDETKSNTNEIVEDGTAEGRDGRKMGGSWRLLLDQNNRARWSPLHLSCVSGGIPHGKVSVMKALLKMDENETSDEVSRQCQQRILTLLDRQNRNILHLLLDSLVPSEQAFDDVRFLTTTAPALLFQKDNRGKKIPLAYVLGRIMENPGTRRRHFMNSYGNNGQVDEGMKRNYLMLKLLVGCMERETRRWGELVDVDEKAVLLAALSEEDFATESNANETTRNSGNDNDSTKNVLHCACLIPQHYCPSDGSLLTYLSSENASKLEASVRGDEKCTAINMAAETDENGNHALHLFVSNKSYAIDDGSNSSDEAAPDRPSDDTTDTNAPQYNTEYKIMKELLDLDPSAPSIPNDKDQLPFTIAMKSGRRQAVAILVIEYHEAVLLGDSMENIQLFMHVLGCISIPCNVICPMGNGVNGNGSNANDDVKQEKIRLRCLTTMFELIRAQPGILSLAGSSEPKLGSKEDNQGGLSKTKKWWRRLNPFL